MRIVHHFRISSIAVSALLLSACASGALTVTEDNAGPVHITEVPGEPNVTTVAPPESPNVTVESEFIQRGGSNLVLHGKTWRFSGTNVYWLAGADKGQVREAYATAQAMGGRIVRANSLGTYMGFNGSVEPTLNKFDDSAFASLDYAVQMAAKYGQHLQIPLVDDYGTKYTFLNWRGLSNGNDFYTNRNVINDFKAWIKHILTHVNTLTGVAYKDDPTIAIWETGNELGAYMLNEGAPPVAWTTEIADYIKSIDPNHLVMDGSDGINAAALAISSVDIYSDHFYPISLSIFRKDLSTVLAAKKVLVIGEYDWTDNYGGDGLANFTAALEASGAAGDVYWDLWVHDPTCSSFEQHTDLPNKNQTFTLHYPGDNQSMKTHVTTLRQHAYNLQGVTTPPAAPTVACPQPTPP